MSEPIGLQELIYQVKQELLAPNPKAKAAHPYPLFAIDKIELEIAVSVTREAKGGIRVSVVEFGGSVSRERGHVVTVSLSPLLSPEEIRQQAIEAYGAEIVRREARNLVKGPDLPGED